MRISLLRLIDLADLRSARPCRTRLAAYEAEAVLFWFGESHELDSSAIKKICLANAVSVVFAHTLFRRRQAGQCFRNMVHRTSSRLQLWLQFYFSRPRRCFAQNHFIDIQLVRVVFFRCFFG